MEPGRAGIEVVMLVTVVTNKIAGINNITLSKRPGMSKAKDVTKNTIDSNIHIKRDHPKSLKCLWGYLSIDSPSKNNEMNSTILLRILWGIIANGLSRMPRNFFFVPNKIKHIKAIKNTTAIELPATTKDKSKIN